MPCDWSFVSIDMELTNQCSSECLMCPRNAISRPMGFMQEDKFKIVSEKLISEGSLITFSGMGDPLLHPKVFDYIYYIRRRGCDVGIVANPASLSANNSQKLMEVRPNSVTLSFPSIKKTVFEKLCPDISFNEALKRVKQLIGLAQGKVGVRMTGIITEINRDESDEYVRFWKELGIPSNMIVCHSRGGNLKAPDIYNPSLVRNESVKCGLFHYHTFITWEGEVLACCHDLTGATRIGNLVNDDASVIAERKQKILEDFMSFPICRRCDESLRQCFSPQGLPPLNRKERIRFFRKSIRSPILKKI